MQGWDHASLRECQERDRRIATSDEATPLEREDVVLLCETATGIGVR